MCCASASFPNVSLFVFLCCWMVTTLPCTRIIIGCAGWPASFDFLSFDIAFPLFWGAYCCMHLSFTGVYFCMQSLYEVVYSTHPKSFTSQTFAFVPVPVISYPSPFRVSPKYLNRNPLRMARYHITGPPADSWTPLKVSPFSSTRYSVNCDILHTPSLSLSLSL